ncbi:exodeoxyribonuclease V subunit alpha [Pseudolysobacter antarcticus]|uniref:RecBCD enzyme subunit RecD n=1 Tax=Pseudolysobacter antarcticus TaxID=2511995 RepID=A0A411HJ99_9GAMM|nr:exodeoxyribonuclease V subunit alpha [Pseudolysobacter antarcticus]QBB70575.1 exodeoxyribonuclease V subunit alpha [Pseudolysobacter antarcticus]
MNMQTVPDHNVLGSIGLPSAFDYALADSLMHRSSMREPWLRELIAQLSAAVQQGHSCLPLQELCDALDSSSPNDRGFSGTTAQLHERLCASGLVSNSGAESPLICDGINLYLRRYFEYERRIAEDLLRRVCGNPVAFESLQLREQIERLFPASATTTPNWQRVAAALALRQNLTVILGGPGSGKTWTVLRLLVLIAQQTSPPLNAVQRELEPQEKLLRIALAAPTGKAARRVSDSLQRDLAELPVSDELRASLPREATTLHRLLGMRPHSSTPRYDRKNPLPLDVLVLDEASMIDLPSMARVLDALPRDARLILLGDPDQLASIEIGNVLSELRAFNVQNRYSPQAAADIAALTGAATEITSDATARFGDAMVTLTHSHRFSAGGSIAQLVEAVRDGDTDRACEILRHGSGVVWHEHEQNDALAQTLQIATQKYAPLQTAATPEQALNALAHFRVLGALREGPWGTRALNASIARAQLGLKAWQSLPPHFPSAPLLITENDHALRLYNGDSGVLLIDTQQRLRAWFADTQHGVRGLSANQLPAFELGYAMTVHKAQGSEYDTVLVLLPPQPHPLLTREWLYTALSRARKQLIVIGSESVLRAAIGSPAQRWSGLAAQITGLLGTADRSAVSSS